MKLLNADCTQIINELPKDNCCVVSDPPFNIGYHYNEYKDNMKESEYLKMLCKLWGGVQSKGNNPLSRNITQVINRVWGSTFRSD